MNPEQQAEYRRRENRKSFTTTMAVNAMVNLLQASTNEPDSVLVKRSWDIAELMAEQMAERGCEAS